MWPHDRQAESARIVCAVEVVVLDVGRERNGAAAAERKLEQLQAVLLPIAPANPECRRISLGVERRSLPRLALGDFLVPMPLGRARAARRAVRNMERLAQD